MNKVMLVALAFAPALVLAAYAQNSGQTNAASDGIPRSGCFSSWFDSSHSSK